VRVSSECERVYVKDRSDLARLVGTLLGCHNGHSFFVDGAALTLEVPVEDLACVRNARLPLRFNLDEPSTAPSTTPSSH
jgi:hypothetical protein